MWDLLAPLPDDRIAEHELNVGRVFSQIKQKTTSCIARILSKPSQIVVRVSELIS